MEKIKFELEKIIKKMFGVEVAPVLMVPPAETGADYASNVAMMLSKQVGKAPREVAEMVAKEIRGGELGAEMSVEVAGPGFLNFISRDAYLLERLEDMEEVGGINISRGEYSGKTVICEFSDPNPFKVLHVGHLYTSVVGEAISKLFEQDGAKVVRANFGGDVGMHVAKAMWGILQQRKEFLALAEEKEGVLGKRAGLMAKCYVLGTEAFEKDEKQKQEIVELNKVIYEIVRKGIGAEEVAGKNREASWNLRVDFGGGSDEAKGEKKVVGVGIEEIARLYWLGREWSYAYFEDFYKQVGAKFDRYYPESSVADKGLEKVKEGLMKGVYEESEGAVVYRGEKYGLHTRVFINNEGLPTYEAKDTGLIFRKWEDYKFDLSVVITGNDIVDYMKVVLSSIAEYAPELPKRTRHLTHGNVRLPGNEKMSSRKGNFLKAVDVLDLVKGSLKEKYGTVDERVALAAVKYAFLKYKIGGNIIFNVEDSVSMTGNSGPYLQYAAVRAKKILAGVGGGYEVESCGVGESCEAGNCVVVNSGVIEGESGWVLNEYERGLAKKILQYGEVMEVAVKEMAPHKLCEYLYNLAQEFSRFYEHVKVMGSEREMERARLVGQYLAVMEAGLKVLGIEVPEEM